MYKYKHFIPENVAPKDAEKIVAYDESGKAVCDISLGWMKPPTKTKLYSFMAISDVHINESTHPTSTSDFINALNYAKENCDFTCICGDLTNAGTDSELANYKSLVDTYAKTDPETGLKLVYAMSGNHEATSGVIPFDRMTPYTGYPLYYSFTKGDDVFVMVGTYRFHQSELLSIEELQWLYETLEENRNKRCFVFQHVFPWGGSGNALGAYTHNIFTGTRGTVFENLMKHYKNVVLFHGHSHLRFYLQELDKTANYSSARGYRSIHIPSLSAPRDIADSGYTEIYAESEGYIVDVYDNYIILNGRDFADTGNDGHILPIATYKIDTTLQTIAANTFTDSTGTITT